MPLPKFSLPGTCRFAIALRSRYQTLPYFVSGRILHHTRARPWARHLFGRTDGTGIVIFGPVALLYPDAGQSVNAVYLTVCLKPMWQELPAPKLVIKML